MYSQEKLVGLTTPFKLAMKHEGLWKNFVCPPVMLFFVGVDGSRRLYLTSSKLLLLQFSGS